MDDESFTESDKEHIRSVGGFVADKGEFQVSQCVEIVLIGDSLCSGPGGRNGGR